MAISVNNNSSAALIALQDLGATQDNLSQTQSIVASGLSVSAAKDNPAIWSIAQNQQQEDGGLDAVIKNLNRATSISDVAAASHVEGVNEDTLELVTSVGRLPTQAAVVSSLKVGGVTVTNARAMIVSPGALQMREVSSGLMPQTIDGVIGFDVIRSLDLTIDDVNDRVIIRKPSPRASRKGDDHARNLSWYGVPIVTLLSETGAAVHLVLDTGAEETFGTPGMATKTHARWRAAERRTVQGFGGSKSESGIVIPSVRLYLGDTPLTFKRIFLYEARYPTIFALDGTLGADVGRGGIVRIDMTNGRLDIRGK